MSLGITAGSIVSAVADATGDDGPDARAKLLRLINEVGPDFCNITDWPFTRSDLTYNITSAAYKYSGANYLPATFKRIIASYTLFNNERSDLYEVGIKETYDWQNPQTNPGRPDKFCVTRNESGFYEIQFNHLPDQTYGIYHELELQWSDISAITETILVTKEFYGAFAHYVKMARFNQQGDSEGFQIADKLWFDPMTGTGIKINALSMLRSPSKQQRVKMARRYVQPFVKNRGIRDYK